MRLRRGFTLIELLVVIAIIGILVSLLLSAVMKTIVRIDEVKTRNDISQLDQAIQSFKTKYKVDYIPSKIKLCKFYNQYGNTPLDNDSKQYLTSVWPHIVNSAGNAWNTPNGLMQWDGTPAAGVPFILEGHQCLVFFLGGIPSTAGGTLSCQGFSTNPANPAAPGGDRVIFYDFLTNRLVQVGNFLAYKDGYGKNVYAYFSSYKSTNGYNRYVVSPPFVLTNTDCGSLMVAPYAEGWDAANSRPVRYLNPNSYQIISAGLDKTFGKGTYDAATIWNPRNPALSPTQGGFDDMSNFSDRFLGIPVN